MRLASLVKIAVEKCILSTIKVPTEWNTNCQIIKKNNTTTQKKASGWFFPDAFLIGFTQMNPTINEGLVVFLYPDGYKKVYSCINEFGVK